MPMTRRISQSNISAYFGQPADTDFEVKRHTHTLPLPHELTRYSPCMIAVCLDGSARLAFSTAVHTFAKGEILCIVPGSYVCIESVTEDFSVCYGVIKESFMYDITSRFPNAMSDYLKQHPNIPMTPEAIDEAIRYFDLMELKMAEKFNLFQKDIIFNILYSYMLDMYNLINKKLPYVELPLGKTTVENMFDRFSSMAARHIRENNPTSYYASALNISPKHLNRIVKQQKGMSVKQWLDSYLLQEIKRELLHTSLSLKEISIEFSFPSCDSMHHFFKKHTGMSPSTYRLHKITVEDKTAGRGKQE